MQKVARFKQGYGYRESHKGAVLVLPNDEFWMWQPMVAAYASLSTHPKKRTNAKDDPRHPPASQAGGAVAAAVAGPAACAGPRRGALPAAADPRDGGHIPWIRVEEGSAGCGKFRFCFSWGVCYIFCRVTLFGSV